MGKVSSFVIIDSLESCFCSLLACAKSSFSCFKMGDTTHSPNALLDVNYREGTFSTRPRDFNGRLKPRDLAEAGFVHFAEQNVKCYRCGFLLNSGLFNNLSEVLKFHGEMRPDCERSAPSGPSSSIRLCNGNALDVSNRSTTGVSSSDRQTNSDAIDVPHRGPSKYPRSVATEPCSVGTTSNSASGSRDNPTTTTILTRNVKCKGFQTFDSLRYERERLSTFIDWPVPWLSPEALAKDGFYYLRDEDKVSCVFCRGIVGSWDVGDIPSQEHKTHFSKCPFVRGQPVGNVPIAQGDLLASLPAVGPCESPATAASIAAPLCAGKIPSKGKQCSALTKKSSLSIQESSADPLEDLPQYSGPKRKEFLTKDSREKSYRNWPKKIKQTPQSLAEAGFFYCGLSDHVRCFHCGNGLRNWEAHDDPWVEHARWYPTCNFVLLQKGLDFIDEVQRVNPPYFRHHQSSPTDHSPLKVGSSSPPAIAPFVSQTYTSDVSSNYRVRITESQLDLLTELDIVKSVLGMGFSPRAVRKALRQKIEETGVPFFNLETCIEKVLTCVEQMESEVEAEKQQDAKLLAYQREREERIRQSREQSLLAYQREREERIRQSHEQSLLRAASASSERREGVGMDVVNTERRSPPRTERSRVTGEDSSTRSSDSLRLSCPGQCPRTPIITSPVMPPRRESNLLRSPPHQASASLSLSTSSPSDDSSALSSNIMQRSLSLSSSSSEENVMESEDIIEYPLRRHEEEAPMDAISSPIASHDDASLDVDRDITPTNDDFNTTSTPRASPSGDRMFGSSTPTGIVTGTNWTSSPSTSSEHYSQSSTASTSSATAADPVSLEMINQVNKVITLAEKEQKRVYRHLSSSSTKSAAGSSTASSDGESGLDDSNCSMSEGEQDNTEEQLSAANKQVADLKDQLERLRESRLCKICMDAELSVMLLPCTHMATCVNCTLALTICPICRTDIKHVIKPNIVA